MNASIITRATAKDMIKNFPKGKIFSMVFERVAPKCEHCNISNAKWKHTEIYCPKCGQQLSTERVTLAQTGVHNPSDPSIKPKGVGLSAKEALEQDLIKYYDVNAKGYRSARLNNIKQLRMNGKTYILI